MAVGGERRVVVTGLGVVSPLGSAIETFWTNMTKGVSGIRRITRFDPSPFLSQIAGEVTDFDAVTRLPHRDVVRTDLFIHYALAAAYEAIDDARLNVAANAERIGVSIGASLGGIPLLMAAYDTLQRNGPEAVSPYTLPGFLVNMPAGWVSMRLGARGPIACAATACTAGSQAIGEGFRMIQRGEADAMVVGGSDAAITPIVVASFCALHALSMRNDDPGRASRPFDKERDGFVLAEGAGLLVLEERERAYARGARIYAELAGYGISADAHHPTAPTVDGPARAMNRALDDARFAPKDVEYINAHGTSTPANDRNETQAIKSVFGEHATRLAVSSTKSMTGHLIGAAGAVEAIATILSIDRGIVPPTINYQTPDPECDLDYVPNEARVVPVRVALSNSFGFGGANAGLVFCAPSLK